MSAQALPDLPTIDDFNLLLEVVTHKDIRPTTPVEPREWGDAERLAELGSQVLSAAVTSHLFSKRPRLAVDELKSGLVHWTSPDQLNTWLENYQLKQKLRAPPDQAEAIYNDLEQMAAYFHSYVGGVYVTKGQSVIEAWISSLIDPDANTGTPTSTPTSTQPTSEPASSRPINVKPNIITTAFLNQTAMQRRASIEYVPSQEGPPHLPTWTVRCYIDGAEKGIGVGPTQKAARDDAAQQAWVALGW